MASPGTYRPVLSDEAAEFLVQQPKARQRKILGFARQLAADPFVRSDYVIADDSGRELEHLLIDAWVFTYWVDHAVCELRIVEIEDAS